MNLEVDNLLLESLKEVMDLTPNALGFFDRDYRLLYCNDVMASVLGKPKEQAVGQLQKDLLREAYNHSIGIKIDADNFDTWFDEVEKTQRSVEYNQYETDTNEGQYYNVTRMTLSNGMNVIVGANITELKKIQMTLTQAITDIEQLANTDELTGIYNRRYFIELSEKEIGRAKRYDHPLSLIVIDIDFFKAVNDGYGHHVGDTVLSFFCKQCNEQLRDSDTLCRVGGEEFAILLPHTQVNHAGDIAERIRLCIKASEIPYDDSGSTLNITLSLGVTQFKEGDINISDLLIRGDKALYQAKDSGRDQYVVQL
ncbi:sensor domain-containing diguanylate cyclase [Thalassomonas sp. RHCl1]|uniref:sensor domain-containing diguanylate cyclase n=1 Tax=Thalassomonas sp. RHCl1 TaxID=2995320 RepID=UPI00248B861D|nr:sensor domain-containing diguanylate cyclase [Thalassomonas sp. RHCl1]